MPIQTHQAKRLDTCVHGYIAVTCLQCQINQEVMIEATMIIATTKPRDITWEQQCTLALAARVLAGGDI